ncbi:unnamed protein product, partial [Ixodes pacificus]
IRRDVFRRPTGSGPEGRRVYIRGAPGERPSWPPTRAAPTKTEPNEPSGCPDPAVGFHIGRRMECRPARLPPLSSRFVRASPVRPI